LVKKNAIVFDVALDEGRAGGGRGKTGIRSRRANGRWVAFSPHSPDEITKSLFPTSDLL
jgi:hypothetical protein